jgi:anaerobic magnesium-protoporphyrin IX monomethyl ester cyclase
LKIKVLKKMSIIGKKNILLIVLPYLVKRGNLKSSKLRSFKAFPYGLLSVATYLKTQAGDKVNIQVLDCNLNDETDFTAVIKEKLNEFKPDIVGLSMMFDISYKHLKDISATVKEFNNNIVTVLGGSAATTSYATIINEQNNIDAVCFYEGEIPLLEMIKSENIPDFLDNNSSWITKKSFNEGMTPQKSSVQNLDEVIDVDYSFVDISGYSMSEGFSPFASKIKQRKQFFLVTSRGCPFRCVFCMHSADKDKSMRYASVEAIIKHVRFLISKYGMNILTIYDDQLFFNKKRAKELFREFARFNLRIECPNGLSVAFIDEELVELMRKAGMDTVCLAIESGSPYVLNEIIHKPLKLEMVKPVVQSLRKYGFWIQGFFVSGLPGEKDQHREETVKFIKDVGLDWSGFTLAIPTRGSDLFNICLENGYIKKDMKIDELDVNRFIINTPEYSADYVIKKTYFMNLDVNFVNNNRIKNGDYGVASDAFRDVIKKYGNHAFAYYYLSKALSGLNENQQAQAAMAKYHEILKTDSEWQEYTKYFNIN